MHKKAIDCKIKSQLQKMELLIYSSENSYEKTTKTHNTIINVSAPMLPSSSIPPTNLN